MKKKAAIVAVLALVLVLASIYLRRSSPTPPGQQPLIELSADNLGEFGAAFDSVSDAARLVLLLSPT